MLFFTLFTLLLTTNCAYFGAANALLRGTSVDKKFIYLTSEKDVYYHNEIPQAISSSKLTGSKYVYKTAPLRDYYNNTKVIGIWSVREFRSLRDSYTIGDYEATYHFFDSKFPGGSSLTRTIPYISVSNGIY